MEFWQKRSKKATRP